MTEEKFPEDSVTKAARALVETQSEAREVKIRHSSVEIDPSQILIPREQAIEELGINGNILAVIGLPQGKENKEKELALVDFGEQAADRKVTTTIYKGIDMGHVLGFAQSRFGLKAFNYKPDDHIASYVPLQQQQTTFGREYGHENHMLGIDESNNNSDYVSRKHFTLILRESGIIILQDHSTNGTTVRLPVSL